MRSLAKGTVAAAGARWHKRSGVRVRASDLVAQLHVRVRAWADRLWSESTARGYVLDANGAAPDEISTMPVSLRNAVADWTAGPPPAV